MKKLSFEEVMAVITAASAVVSLLYSCEKLVEHFPVAQAAAKEVGDSAGNVAAAIAHDTVEQITSKKLVVRIGLE